MSQNDLFDSAPKSEVKETKSRSRLGVMATALLGGSLVALYAVAAPFVTPALRKVCLPFVPATTAQVENVLRVLQSRTGTLVDIGSGDGRIVSTRSWTDGQIHRPGAFIDHEWCLALLAPSLHPVSASCLGVPGLEVLTSVSFIFLCCPSLTETNIWIGCFRGDVRLHILAGDRGSQAWLRGVGLGTQPLAGLVFPLQGLESRAAPLRLLLHLRPVEGG